MMKITSISRDRQTQRTAGCSVGLGVCLLLTLVLVFPLRAADSEEPAQPVRVVGPLAAKDMMESIAREFRKTNPQVQMKYRSVGHRGAAAGAMVAGQELLLTLGKPTEKDLSLVKDRWKELAPDEHVIGAQAVAIVVHPRNPLESLTLKQLQSIYAGEVKDWSVFGGRRNAIRRYGLAFNTPETNLFQDKVLPAAKCRMVTRKKNSTDVADALASDPDGIAYMDATVATMSGKAIRVIGISQVGFDDDNAEPVVPNAQTIEDGTYPFATTLVLYMSPKASADAQSLGKYILAGKCDAILREHGFMPTVRNVQADVLAVFEKLYGPDIERVKGTYAPEDDLALARQILDAARTTKLNEPLIEAMCDAAYGLVVNISGGETTAFGVLNVLGEKVPSRRFDCAAKRVELSRRVYTTEPTPANGEFLMRSLTAQAELATSLYMFPEALDAWKSAIAIAGEVNAPIRRGLEARLPAFEARVKSAEQAAALTAKLESNARDIEARARLLTLYLRELDNPAEATRYLDATRDEAVKTNVLLASEPVERLSEEVALNLAEWYGQLMEEAATGGRPLMAARAKAYYAKFFETHRDHDDALGMRAALGMKKIGGHLPRADEDAENQKPRNGELAGLKPGETITDMTFAEFIAAHPKLTAIGPREIGTAGELTSLRPLEQLPELRSLDFDNASKVEDLSPLAKLTKLESLTLKRLPLADIELIGKLGNLKRLNLNGADDITDLSPLKSLPRLEFLSLQDCDGIEDLKPIENLTSLTFLNLANCDEISDIKPLANLSRELTWLNLNGTKIDDVMPLARMGKLKRLDLRDCRKLDSDDIKWLKKRLSNCEILENAVPAAQPAEKKDW